VDFDRITASQTSPNVIQLTCPSGPLIILLEHMRSCEGLAWLQLISRNNDDVFKTDQRLSSAAAKVKFFLLTFTPKLYKSLGGPHIERRKMKPPPTPSLLEVIRLLLHRIEQSSYPNSDPIAIGNLKAHLRCRIAELALKERLKLPSPQVPERSPLLCREEWWLPRSQRSCALSPGESAKEDRSIRSRPAPRSQLSLAKSAIRNIE
jgi:hypothetical protein